MTAFRPTHSHTRLRACRRALLGSRACPRLPGKLFAIALLLLPPALPGAAEENETILPSGNGDSGSPALQTRDMPSVLPADEAFALNALIELPDTLVLQWEIREGYYLYRKSLAFTAAGESSLLGQPSIPEGEHINDEFFGDVEVYHDHLQIHIPLSSMEFEQLELQLQFQGCAEAGYCYPMQHKTVTLEP